MDKVFNKINLCIGSVVGVLLSIFGQYWYLFAAFFVLNVIDYLTGWVKARMLKIENSKKGAKGIIKKVGYWVVIAIAFFIAFAFSALGDTLALKLDFLMLFGWFTLATFIINEIRSVLENLTQLGVKVPGFLLKGLEIASSVVEKSAGGKQ